MSLIAITGIGVSDQIEIATTTLKLAQTTTGMINLRDLSGGLIVTEASTSNSNIILEAVGGDLHLQKFNLPGTNATATLRTLNSGSLFIGLLHAPSNSVLVASAQRIEEGSPPDTTADIIAGSINLQAQTGIGTNGPIELIYFSLTTSSPSGGVQFVRVL